MGKGSGRRICQVSPKEYADNYDRIFKGVEPAVPTATATAIVKQSETWPNVVKEYFPMSLSEVDKENHDD